MKMEPKLQQNINRPKTNQTKHQNKTSKAINNQTTKHCRPKTNTNVPTDQQQVININKQQQQQQHQQLYSYMTSCYTANSVLVVF